MTLKKRLRSLGLAALLVTILLSGAACTADKQPVKQQSEGQQVPLQQIKRDKGVHILSVIPYGSDARIEIKTIENNRYIPAQLLADVLEYKTMWDEDTLGMKLGVNGPEFELQSDNSKALKGDKQISLPLPPVMEKDSMYIPVDSLAALFGSDMSFEATETEVTIHPTKNRVKSLEEDVTAPPVPQEDMHYWENAVLSPDKPASSMVRIPGQQRIAASDDGGGLDFDEMEATAKRYLGIKYKFGTGPFSQTGFFDCSSFMQFLFGKQNVDLPRTARGQAEQGMSVKRGDLQKGDLLFFYVPGRFRSDEVVGHVGLYLGDGTMIHSSPQPEDGVQLTDINQQYWRDTYLKATRITRGSQP